MATAWQKQVRKALEETTEVYPDKIVCRQDGTVEVKRAYFYGHRGGVESWGGKVQSALASAEIDFGSMFCRDDFRQWPTTSYYVAVVSQ